MELFSDALVGGLRFGVLGLCLFTSLIGDGAVCWL